MILGGFVLTGAWLCLPIMETPVGSASVNTSKPAVDSGAEQSLDSVGAGNATGSAIDLSMDGAGKRKGKSDEAIASMLYQAPPEAGAAAAGAPLGSSTGGSSASLAQVLKSVGDKKKDEAGWGEKAQKGFSAPRLGGSGMSGLGGGGGGSSASASASSGMGAFGSKGSQISFGGAKGLKDDGSADKTATGTQAALKGAAKASIAAAAAKSNDAARGGAGSFFDGSKGQAAAVGMPAGGPSGDYAALDAAPTNLKLNDPKLDQKELKAPPGTDVPTAASDDNQMAKQMAMMVATAVIGGMLPGAGGQMVMMMGMMMMQQQQAQASAAKSAAEQKAAEKRMGSS